MPTRAEEARDAYLARRAIKKRTRFTPKHDVKTERDASLPGVVFYRFPDGSMLRLHHSEGDPQVF